MNMKLDSLLVVSAIGWAVLLLAIINGVHAKPFDGVGTALHSRRSYHHRAQEWIRDRTVPDFVVGALEQLHHREKRFPRVPMGTRCSSDSHCPADHCCAKKLGSRVCLPRLSQGRTCALNGRRAYSTDHLFIQCPCNHIEGLTCERSGSGGGRMGVCSPS